MYRPLKKMPGASSPFSPRFMTSCVVPVHLSRKTHLPPIARPAGLNLTSTLDVHDMYNQYCTRKQDRGVAGIYRAVSDIELVGNFGQLVRPNKYITKVNKRLIKPFKD